MEVAEQLSTGGKKHGMKIPSIKKELIYVF